MSFEGVQCPAREEAVGLRSRTDFSPLFESGRGAERREDALAWLFLQKRSLLSRPHNLESALRSSLRPQSPRRSFCQCNYSTGDRVHVFREVTGINVRVHNSVSEVDFKSSFPWEVLYFSSAPIVYQVLIRGRELLL